MESAFRQCARVCGPVVNRGRCRAPTTWRLLCQPRPAVPPSGVPRPRTIWPGSRWSLSGPSRPKGSVCGNPLLRGRTIPPIASRVRGCGLQDGVELTSVAGVRVGEGVQVDCTTALALADWVHDRLKPTVGNLGGGVVALETGPTYACRPRNNQKGNRVSEHGRGAAVDIMGIRLASGAMLSVRDDWGKAKEGRVLKAIHASACGPFTTVLGPKSDRFHKDHFHIDTAQGRGPYCR